MAKQPSNKSTKKNKSASGSKTEVGDIHIDGNVGGPFVLGNNNVINMTPAQQAFRSLHQLPQPPADFTGREELIAQLLADFEKGKGATITSPIHGLTGMGGIGKTALGLVVAHQLKNDYPDAQIFLDLKGTTTPLSAMDVMRHVILSFEPAMDLRALDDTSISTAYQSVLHEKKVLLFLDNARSADQVAPLRPPETCALLVTSRWTFSVPGLKNRHVGVMSQENAEKFLLELCPRISDAEQAAGELAKACVYLPLALRIAGSFLQVNPDWRVEKYITRLTDRKQRLPTLKLSREEAELKTEPDLLATFELSYSALSEENQKRWRMLGVFSGSFNTSAARAMWDLEEDAAGKLLGLLHRYSLLDYDETFSRCNLHDLLADFALTKMEKEEEVNARIAHSVYYSEVLENINQMYLQGKENILPALRLYDAEWINIEAGQRTSALYLDENRDAAQACNDYACQGSINELRLKPKDRIKWIEAGSQAARVLENRKAEGDHLTYLGRAYIDLGEARKAIQFYEQALGIAHEIRNRRCEGAALIGLGIAYSELSEARRAIEFYQQALGIAREIGDRRGEGNALGNLGNAYWELGEARKAIQFYEQALVIQREIGDRNGEGYSLSCLGSAYEDLGEVREAIEFYEQALTIRRQIGDRRGEGYSLGHLGIAYKILGEARRAIEFYEQALGIAREISDRRGEGNALGNLGNAYRELGEARKAIQFHEQALVIDLEIGYRRGEGHDLGNLGSAYADLGEARKAIQFYEQALVIQRETGDRNGEGYSLDSLGRAYRDLGEARKAIEFHEQALGIAREIGERRYEGYALDNLGSAYADLGEARKAIKFHEQGLFILREIGDRRREGNALFQMGLALHSLEEKDRAIDLMKQAFETYEAIESPYSELARKKLKEWGVL